MNNPILLIKYKYIINSIIYLFIFNYFFEITLAKNSSLRYDNNDNYISSHETTSIALIICCFLFFLLGYICKKKL
jgi:hypothetical protein